MFKLLVALLLVSSSVFAAEKELSIKLKQDGKPSFGIQYAYDADVAWAFTYTTTISNETLASLPATVFWNLYDESTQEYISDWVGIDKNMLLVGSLAEKNKPVLTKLLPNLKTIKVVFGTELSSTQIEPKFNIPIGPLCQNYAGTNFTDLTNFSKKGCEVTEADLFDWEAECKEWGDELLDYVKQGLLTCNIAEKQYEKRGCGILDCKE